MEIVLGGADLHTARESVKCRCGEDTDVLDTRLAGLNCVRRRRVCRGCGRRFTTWETTRVPSQMRYIAKNRAAETERIQKWRTAHPEKMARIRLREAARKEAAATGRPVNEIYQEWGCA